LASGAGGVGASDVGFSAGFSEGLGASGLEGFEKLELRSDDWATTGVAKPTVAATPARSAQVIRIESRVDIDDSFCLRN
jgi:hypothetical protein